MIKLGWWFSVPQTSGGRGRLPRLVTALSVLSLALAGCGSRVDPDTVAAANRADTALVSGRADGDPGSTPGEMSLGGPLPDGGSAPGQGDGADGAISTATDPGAAAPAPGSGVPEAQPATGGVRAASCAGFDGDQPGVTADSIVLANASDISGPVPGLFESARQATNAYVAFFNSTSDLCGRKLEVLNLDSRADGGADQQAYTKACTDAFAAVGSMSSFDSGGAAVAQECGLPDLRSTAVTPERNACSTCFSAQAVDPDLVPSSVPRYWVGANRAASQNAAVLYVSIGAAAVNAAAFREAWTRSGMKITYFQGIDVSEFNYTPYVQQMKDRGVRFVTYLGPYQFTVRLQQAMQQQGFAPDVFLQDPTIYDQRYVQQAGAAGEGSYVYSTTRLFDDTSVPEMRLYRSWLEQTAPGAIPNYYGLYAWSATRLFVQQATALGGRLTRATLVESLRRVRNWTGNGLHAPEAVGAKETANCRSIIRLTQGRWRQVSPGDYLCAPLVDTGG